MSSVSGSGGVSGGSGSVSGGSGGSGGGGGGNEASLSGGVSGNSSGNGNRDPLTQAEKLLAEGGVYQFPKTVVALSLLSLAKDLRTIRKILEVQYR